MDTLSDTVRGGGQDNCGQNNLCGGRGTGQTEADTLAGVEAYTVVHTLNEVEAKALVYTQVHTFLQLQAKRVTDTLSDIEAESPVETVTDPSRGDGRDTGRHT